jgi:nucleotide-binding universal stress UspA family protein
VVPFGEENFLIDAVVASETDLAGEELWVSLRDWTILNPPLSRLLVTDLGDGLQAPLKIAQYLAPGMRASTTILAVAENPEAGEKLRAAFNTQFEEGLIDQADLHIRYGNAVEQIAVEKAEALYDLLLFSGNPLRAARRLPNPYSKTRNLNKTLETLLQSADTPILIVKGERERIQRILICTAAGEPGKSDVKIGGRLARQIGASVTLLYVAGEGQEPSALTRSHLERAARTLRGLEVECQVEIRQSASPVAGILEETESGDFDLIVLGSHGPRSKSRFRVNDVTLQVLTETSRPVLIVPPEDS